MLISAAGLGRVVDRVLLLPAFCAGARSSAGCPLEKIIPRIPDHVARMPPDQTGGLRRKPPGQRYAALRART